MRRLKLVANPRVALGVIAVHVALLSALLWFTSRKPAGPEAPKHIILQTVTVPPLNAPEPPATRLPAPVAPRPAEAVPKPIEQPIPKRPPEKTSQLDAPPTVAAAVESTTETAAAPSPAVADGPAPVPVTTVAAVAAVVSPAAPPRDIDVTETVAARPDHERCPHAGYPMPLRERGIEGTVWLRVQVTRDGLPAAVSVLRGSGWRLFDEAALQAARACRFIPARLGAERLASWVEFPMRFALDS